MIAHVFVAYMIAELAYRLGGHFKGRFVVKNSNMTPEWRKCTWIKLMVVLNSQPWGIGHWFVFKRVCVHVHFVHMKDVFFRLFLNHFNTYQLGLIPKLTNHINKKVNILMAPLITNIKQNLHQKIQEMLVCSAAYLSVNMFVFKQQSFHSEVMERSWYTSFPVTIKSLPQERIVYLCIVTSSKLLKSRRIFHMVFPSFILKKLALIQGFWSCNFHKILCECIRNKLKQYPYSYY